MLKAYIARRKRSLPLDWNREFERSAPLNIEIGFGNGEHLAKCGSKLAANNYRAYGNLLRLCMTRWSLPELVKRAGDEGFNDRVKEQLGTAWFTP